MSPVPVGPAVVSRLLASEGHPASPEQNGICELRAVGVQENVQGAESRGGRSLLDRLCVSLPTSATLSTLHSGHHVEQCPGWRRWPQATVPQPGCLCWE